MSTSTVKQIRSSRTLTLGDLTKSVVRRAYVPAPIDGFIHYVDIPSGPLIDILEPGISVHEQLRGSTNILLASIVNPDGSPFFTRETIGKLSQGMIKIMIRSLLRGDDREGEIEVDADEIEPVASTTTTPAAEGEESQTPATQLELPFNEAPVTGNE